MLGELAKRLSPVLVVEDEELLRLYAADLLKEAGFEVVPAADADDALRVMASRPDIRVLFTDVQLPGAFDGMELARRVHEQWPLVLLLITSGGVKPAENEIFDKGHFLPKPYTGDDVMREIDDLARGRRAREKQPAELAAGTREAVEKARPCATFRARSDVRLIIFR